MTLDVKYQVPTVAVHTHIFHTVSQAVARANGTPRMRQVYVPQPVQGKTPSQLREYIDGLNPITKRPFMREVVEGLTGTLDSEDVRGLSFDRSTPRLCEPDTEENLHQLFLDQNWTDKLPVVLPTEERVATMLAGTHRKPDEVVGRMRPTAFREVWEYTVEKVAVNAVMAGARPEFFPVILALAATGVSARGSTSSSGAVMAVVNGPIRKEIGMNWGIGAMGPYNLANATIGRAYGLLSQNGQGGSVPGFSYMGSQGNAYSFNNVCCAENEDASPWEPFHVGKGFAATDSVVSVFGGMQTTSYTLGLRHKHWREHIRNMLRGMDPNSSPLLVLDPLTARQFVEIAGLPTRETVRNWIAENAQMSAGEYWDYQLVQNYRLPRATFGEEPWASWLKVPEDQLISFVRPQDVNIVVVGGEANAYWRIMGASHAKSVCVDEWR
ncbi:MAG: hypothetical protein JO247_03195 [Chloroflexi bacterium]|nr:hypothetical protein [Chloroflexota bacterium]